MQVYTLCKEVALEVVEIRGEVIPTRAIKVMDRLLYAPISHDVGELFYWHMKSLKFLTTSYCTYCG